MIPRTLILAVAIALPLGISAQSFSNSDARSLAFHQDKTADPKKVDGQPADKKEEPKKEEPKKEEPKKDPKTVEYEKAIKDLPKYSGAFTLYVRKGKDILMEVPEGQVGKLWYLQAAFQTGVSTGSQFGLPIGDDLAVAPFRFDRFGEDHLHLVRPNTKYRWTPDSPYAEASKLAFPEAILGDYRIEQFNPEKKLLLVNVSTLFQGETFNLGQIVSTGLGGTYTLDRDKVTPDVIKGSSDFTVVRMKLHFLQQGAGNSQMAALMALLGMGGTNLENPKSAPVKVTFALYNQPQTGYMPRIADSRVGYFTQDFYSLKRYLEDDHTERYIMRWDLRKKDPKAKVSDPVKPVVWVLDRSIPKDYRDDVRRAVLSWNSAFEKAGISNAFQVVDAETLGDEYDHADPRYNVIRFTITDGSDGAIALFRTDPFTGQILNASVNSDMSWIMAGKQEHESLIWSTTASNALNDSQLTRNDRDPLGIRTFNYLWGFSNPLRDRWNAAFKGSGLTGISCDYESRLAERARYDLSLLEATGSRMAVKEYTDQLISHVIAHEVGHCLGLRHNFVASTNLDVKQLGDPATVLAQGVSGSQMDYTPSNPVALSMGGGQFYTWTPGPYDMHAVYYGYSQISGTSPESEVPALKQIASKESQHGLEFMTDEDADSVDPYVQLFDAGSQPVEVTKVDLEFYRRVRQSAVKNLPKFGESFAKRTKVILGSTRMAFREGASLSRYIGGVQGSRAFLGDPGARSTLRPVDANLQRRAVNLLVSELLSTKSLDIPENVLQSMSYDYGAQTPLQAGWTAPVRSTLSGLTSSLLGSLLSSSRNERILENEFKTTSAQPYTLAEHYRTILEAVFSEVGTSSVAPLRRDLQQYAVKALIDQAGAPAGYIHDEVRATANAWLLRLDNRFKSALKGKVDESTRNHLIGMSANIDRFVSRTRVEGNFGSSPSRSSSLLDALMGGD
ncbi:MAG: zinc-dependent metalloprotease [Armatimonadetes bacterium]|nr:zinc-dependent metalloprotease [Armatimonadota bacterium]